MIHIWAYLFSYSCNALGVSHGGGWGSVPGDKKRGVRVKRLYKDSGTLPKYGKKVKAMAILMAILDFLKPHEKAKID